MKFGPKETKQLNEYLRTGRNRNRQFLTTKLVTIRTRFTKR